jgi:hypothetical protein
VVVATPWAEFLEALPKSLRRVGGRPVVIDCWRMFDASALKDVADVVRLGVASAT